VEQEKPGNGHGSWDKDFFLPEGALPSQLNPKERAMIDDLDSVSLGRKDYKWIWWVAGVAAVLICIGWYSSQHLANAYVRRDTYTTFRNENNTAHNTINSRIVTFDDRLTTLRIEQAQEVERTKLISSRLELLLEVSEARQDPPRTKSERLSVERDQDVLRAEIAKQQKRLERLENDPRMRPTKTTDPLANLNSD
jgi:hypothetical protein